MTKPFEGWEAVAIRLRRRAHEAPIARLDDGQRASLGAIAERIPKNGVLIADEVGMGKTRIAVEVARCVVESGGRVAILVPPGLGFQWKSELHEGGVVQPRELLRGLRGYFDAWGDAEQAQNEPWFNEQLILLSHAFTNWRLGANAAKWRWTLLPEVLAQWQKERTGIYPCGYYEYCEDIRPAEIEHAAKSITKDILSNPRHPARRILDRTNAESTWCHFLDGAGYSRYGDRREWLERVVGFGLGGFNLIVVDEAHKNRGEESGLSRLLSYVVLQEDEARRLALTATPVELDESQWIQTLGRLGLPQAKRDAVTRVINEYAEAVRYLRHTWRTGDNARARYKTAARLFETTLSPYMLRRTKREDKSVRQFLSHLGDANVDGYRLEQEISVELSGLAPTWKQAICAAEALSSIVSQQGDPVAKRLRLTLCNGHGISAVLDGMRHDHETDGELPEVDAPEDEAKADRPSLSRAKWWKSVLQKAFAKNDGELFEHPAILAAVEAIERDTERQQKVLVFGRFTRPMRALVGLLNAREMFRCLMKSQSWPQAKVHGDDDADSADSDWPAVRAAHRQVGSPLSLDSLDDALRQQYDAVRRRREQLRRRLVEGIEEGLRRNSPNRHVDSMFAAFRRSVEPSRGRAEDRSHPLLSLIAGALIELLPHQIGVNDPMPSAEELADAFAELMRVVCDRDDFDEVERPGDDRVAELWADIEWRLREEYDRPRGGFARLMYGKTSPSSRRMIQAAFNRLPSFPRVLVAQSMVGREGLNLHKACRVVVLLHPEWNPGVVEQQIGRVDRVGSRWADECAKAIRDGERELPRIEVRPVVFRGTYDEHNWRILRERWDDLRAQLHGIVVPARLVEENPEDRALVAEMARAAPNFSPQPDREREAEYSVARGFVHPPAPL